MKLSTKILIAGLAIIVVTNVVALGGVAYNRSGEPDAIVELTERELSLPYRYGINNEDTGLGLRINCRIEESGQGYSYGNNSCRGNPAWLNSEKLLELGFEPQPKPKKIEKRMAFDKPLPRKAFIVLEYNGPAYQRTLIKAEQDRNEQLLQLSENTDTEKYEKRVKHIKDKLENEHHHNSRLFAIDAGLDKIALRNKYPDTSQYIIMQALIKPTGKFYQSGGEWTGTITQLLASTINISLEHRAVFEPLEVKQPRYNQNKQVPRYKVRVAFGKRAEPWVMAVEKM